MAAEKSHAVDEVTAEVEAVGLAEDPGRNLKLDQATFFRCVENGNLSALTALLKNRKVDINAYNDEVPIIRFPTSLSWHLVHLKGPILELN